MLLNNAFTNTTKLYIIIRFATVGDGNDAKILSSDLKGEASIIVGFYTSLAFSLNTSFIVFEFSSQL